VAASAQNLATIVLAHDGGEETRETVDRLARALEARLIAHLAFGLSVRTASTSGGPSMDGALDGAGDVAVTVPLEPIWSRDMMATYRRLLEDAGRPDVEVVGGWQDDERFHRGLVDRARSALNGGRLDDAAALLVARPLPDEGGGEYHDLAQRLAARLVGMMFPGDWRLVFWDAGEAAGTPSELDVLLEGGWPNVLAVPIGTAVTGADGPALDAALAPAVAEAGRTYARPAPVADDPGLLAALADAVVDYLARRPLPGSEG